MGEIEDDDDDDNHGDNEITHTYLQEYGSPGTYLVEHKVQLAFGRKDLNERESIECTMDLSCSSLALFGGES